MKLTHYHITLPLFFIGVSSAHADMRFNPVLQLDPSVGGLSILYDKTSIDYELLGLEDEVEREDLTFTFQRPFADKPWQFSAYLTMPLDLDDYDDVSGFGFGAALIARGPRLAQADVQYFVEGIFSNYDADLIDDEIETSAELSAINLDVGVIVQQSVDPKLTVYGVGQLHLLNEYDFDFEVVDLFGGSEAGSFEFERADFLSISLGASYQLNPRADVFAQLGVLGGTGIDLGLSYRFASHSSVALGSHIQNVEPVAEQQPVVERAPWQQTPETVAQLQRALLAAGYDTGPADGKMGRKTVRALTEYQQANGLSSRGQVDDATAESLGL